MFGLRFGHPVLGGLAGAAIVTGFVFMMVEGGGHVASRIYHPSGSSTPHKRDYSLAASLAIRGQYAEAAEAYEIAISEFPDDPEPYLRLARLLRDEMDRPEDAVIWFKRARADARISDGQRMLASRELVELYTVKLDQPAKAAPELARLAEKYAGRPEGEWAKNELADVKRRMAEDREG